jgi:chromosome segregation ATPase
MDTELIAYLDHRFAEVDNRFNEVDKRFDEVDRRFDEVDRRFSKVDDRFNEVDRRFSEVDTRFNQVDTRFNQVDTRFNEVEGGFREALDQRIREVHVLIEGLDSKFDTVAEGVLANTEAIGALRSDMERQFDEVKAVNRISYVEIDRRLREHDRRITDVEAR